MSYSMLTHLECSRTGESHEADTVQQLSRAGAPLLARYDLAAVREAASPDTIARRAPDLWRYHELLPVRDPAYVTSLGEGMTPLLPLPRYGASLDDSLEKLRYDLYYVKHMSLTFDLTILFDTVKVVLLGKGAR